MHHAACMYKLIASSRGHLNHDVAREVNSSTTGRKLQFIR